MDCLWEITDIKPWLSLQIGRLPRIHPIGPKSLSQATKGKPLAMPPKFARVSLEGSVAVGKSTILSIVCQQLNRSFALPEPIEDWRHVGGDFNILAEALSPSAELDQITNFQHYALATSFFPTSTPTQLWQ